MAIITKLLAIPGLFEDRNILDAPRSLKRGVKNIKSVILRIINKQRDPWIRIKKGDLKGESVLLDLICMGVIALDNILLVERIPQPDEVIFARKIGSFPGGTSANVAVAAAKLGAKVGFVGKVGNDLNGRKLIDDLKRSNVDASRVLIDYKAETTITYIFIDKQGRRTIIGLPGASELLSYKELDLDYLKSCKIFYTEGASPEVCLKVVRELKKSGIKISLDLSEIGASSGTDTFKNLVMNADILFSNRRSFQLFTKKSDLIEPAKDLTRKGPEIVVITLGDKGCLVITEDDIISKPGFQVKIVDTTGAGDAFHGAFLFGILKGMSLEKAAELANAVAAISITHYGARTGLPTLEQALNFLSLEGAGEKNEGSRYNLEEK